MNKLSIRPLKKLCRFLIASSLLLGGLANAHLESASLDQSPFEPNVNAIVDSLKKGADSGNIESLHRLARVYFSLFCCTDGEVYERNGTVAKQAFDYLITQYKDGDAELEFIIGRFYNFGIGVEENDEMAFSWWLKSANHGNDEAQNNVGYYYEKGRVVTQDLDKALEWYKKSASQNNYSAPANIGTLYYEGIGRQVDCQEALKWFKQAAELGNSIAVGYIERMATAPECAKK